MRARPGLAKAAGVLLLATASSALADADQPRDVARLGGLDKVTARVSRFDVEVGAAHRFNTLSITVEACFEASPTDPPESAAFLEIVDEVPGQPAEEVFSGWMFASSPALSALEHAVYDVWVVDCLTDEELAEKEGDDTDAGAAADAPPPPRRRP